LRVVGGAGRFVPWRRRFASTQLVAGPKARHRCRVMSARTAWSRRLSAQSQMPVRAGAAAGVLVGLACGLGACGSRTGLELDELFRAEADGSPPTVADAAPDVAIPISPVQTPPACVTLPSPSVYVVSTAENLWQFNPSAASSAARLHVVGHIECPLSTVPPLGVCQDLNHKEATATPFSMAVDLKGTAYVVYCDGEVFELDTQTLQCQATGLVPTQGFGMAFSQDTTDPDETLFIATGLNEGTLESIDTTTFAYKTIGNFSPAVNFAELTGTGAGDLFIFYSISPDDNSELSLAKVDKANAALTNILPLPGVPRGAGWAFVFWGGDFYTFTGEVDGSGTALSSTVITRISPTDGSQATVTTMSELVVGAGVSTCAPQR
jgi:hypothetical protein